MKVKIPPIKSQGIKTKLVPWINSLVPPDFNGVWIEPFLGTGVVAFNIAPERALLCDTNPHLINFYQAIAEKSVTSSIAKNYLVNEGKQLFDHGEAHYYAIRERFNAEHNPLDFLFLNRACFNGMIRFNRKGAFNVPFCRKPNRFTPSYITKIVNQIAHISKLLTVKQFSFRCQSFEETIKTGTASDMIYCDPPYIGRHVDYYNGWGEKEEMLLFELLTNTSAHFILSTWHHNDYRENQYIGRLWNNFPVLTREHFYHVGASEENRNPMVEALVTNFGIFPSLSGDVLPSVQLSLLEEQTIYDPVGKLAV